MKAPTSREERKIRDADFARRLQPRMVWPSTREGTVMRVHAENEEKRAYVHRPIVKKGSNARPLTEAENNALARAARRRMKRRLRAAGKPHACR